MTEPGTAADHGARRQPQPISVSPPPLAPAAARLRSARRSGALSGTVWSGTGIVISTATTLLASLLLVATATPATFGDVAVLTVMVMVLATFGRMGTDRLFIGEVQAADQSHGPAAATARGAELLAFSALCGAAVSALVLTDMGKAGIEAALSVPVTLWEQWLIFGWVLGEAIRLVVSEAHRYERQFARATIFGAAARAPLFLIGLVVAALLHGEVNRTQAMTAASVASIVVALAGLISINNSFTWWKARPWAARHRRWRGHGPLLTATLAAILIGAADVYVVGAVVGAQEAGVYGLGLSLVAGVAVVSASISQGLSPFIAAGLASGATADMSHMVVRYVRLASACAALLYAGLLLIAQPVVVFLGGQEYGGVFTIIAVLGLGQLVGVIAGPGGNVLILGRHYRLAAGITLVTSIGMVLGVAVAAMATGSVMWVAAISAAGTGGLHVANAIACRVVLGQSVHAFSRPTGSGSP